MSCIKTKLDLEKLLLEIKEELINQSEDGTRARLVGSQSAVVLAIYAESVVDFSKLEDQKRLMLDINFMNIHNIRVNIPTEYVEDREYIKHQVVAEMCRYFDIISYCFETVKKHIFPYQRKLVEEWEKKVGKKDV